jgi:hypothetical protein
MRSLLTLGGRHRMAREEINRLRLRTRSRTAEQRSPAIRRGRGCNQRVG